MFGALGVLMLRYFFVTLLFFLASCSGDPPLLKTELSNGHEFHSNGGSTGYFTNKKGNRYADIFGIIETGKERWCEGFSWSKSYAICKTEIGNEYVILNTLTGDIFVYTSEVEAKKHWLEYTGQNVLELKTRYGNTKNK